MNPYFVVTPPADGRDWRVTFHTKEEPPVEVEQPCAMDACMWLLGHWADRTAP